MEPNLILLTVAIGTLIAMLSLLVIQRIKNKPVKTISYSPNTMKFLKLKSKVIQSENIYVSEESTNKSELFSLIDNLKNYPLEYSDKCWDFFLNIPLENFNLRWILVYTVTELNLPELTLLLSKIAHLEINDKENCENYNKKNGDEITIRIRAIKGLTNIAVNGFIEAEEVLYDLLKNDCLTLNIAAIEGLIEIDENNFSKIKMILPKEKQFLLLAESKNNLDPLITKSEIKFTNTSLNTTTTLKFIYN